MVNHNRLGSDAPLLPTETQMISAGSLLMNTIRQAIGHNKIVGSGSNKSWFFEIEGSGALVDRDGYVRSGGFGVFRAEHLDAENIRSFYIASSRVKEGGDVPYISDVYKADFYKNTEVLAGLSRAIVDTAILDSTDSIAAEKLREAFESAESQSEFPIKGITEALSYQPKAIEADMLEQMGYGSCSQDELIELMEILQRAKPASPYGHYSSVIGIII